MSSTPNATTTARETANNNPLKNATTLRGIYNSGYEFPGWVLEPNRWDKSSGEKSHKFDDTIVVYDNDDLLTQVKELVEQREPVNIEMNLKTECYKKDQLEKNFGWKTGAYGKSSNLKLYPNIGIYCHARVTNGVSAGAEEKNVHVMNLIGYGFDSALQPDYIYFKHRYGTNKADLKKLDTEDKAEFKKELIQRYRKIWLKACYICKFKGLKNLWYCGVGSGWFSNLLPNEYNKDSGNFYPEIFAEAFGIDPTDVSEYPKKSTLNDKNDLTIPINFCKEYGIKVQNLGTSSSKHIPDVLFTTDTTPEDTLYINAWDPWSIIGNGNAGDESLDGKWGRNSNMSVLGWSMTNSKLLPDIVGGDSGRKSKILSMKEILAEIEAAGGGGSSSPIGSGSTPPPSTPSCEIDASKSNIKNITPECQDAIFSLVTAPVIDPPTGTDEPKEMSNLVSAIGTGYSSKYAGENIMPAGSATLLYIGDTELYNIIQSGSTWTPGSKTNTKIKYMIHASTAKSDNVERDITKDTISNSVMNSLILAAKNGVETIFFPFIGGQIFFDTLKEKVDKQNTDVDGYTPYDTDQHAEILVKGVTDFYTNLSSFGIKSNPIKEIYFVTFNTAEKKVTRTNDKGEKITIVIPEVKEHQAIQKAYDKAKHEYPDLNSVLMPSTRGNVISNAIHYSTYPNIKPMIAIVNAGNTNHGFEDGAGVADMCFAGLGDNSDYQKKLNTIKTKFIEAFTKYINDPTAASSSSKTSSKTKQDVVKVIEGLVNSIKATEDDDTTTLGIKPSNGDFIYENPPSDASSPPSLPKKNLNSAQPDIDTMIKEFETAVDGDETDFYLGACRSIQAAYVLEKGSNADNTHEAMRAKLLLNLRKNSLLLKVPARWDYATMTMGVVEAPPNNEAGLRTYSLQDTIEYYSHAGGDEETRFKELNIAENPTDVSVGSATISGVDGRFVNGIDATMGDVCFFVAALQLLFCDEDFLQLIIFLSCQSDDYISAIQGIPGDECGKPSIVKLDDNLKQPFEPQPDPVNVNNVERGKKILNDLVKLFKAYIIRKKIENELMKSLYDTLALRYAKQQDSSEVITRIIAYLECLDNPYVKKFLSNCFLQLKETITYPQHTDFKDKANTTTTNGISDKLIMIKPPTSSIGSTTLSVQTLVNSYLNEKQDFEFTDGDIKANNIRQTIIEQYLTSTPDFMEKTFCKMCQEFLTFSNYTSNKTQLESIFQGYGDKSKNYTTDNDRGSQSELKITLDAIQKAIQANTSNDEKICHMIVEDIKYVILNPMVKESSSSTYTNLKKSSQKIVNAFSEYIFININRGLEHGKKNLIDITISKKLNIDSSTYTLVGYVFHSGSDSNGGHFVCVKCDSNGEPIVEISDSSVTKWTDKYAKLTEWGIGVFLLIYKKKQSQSGGGSNNIHAITNHSKSRHNSSFKVSSSKTKGKSRNRSHTQRVK